MPTCGCSRTASEPTSARFATEKLALEPQERSESLPVTQQNPDLFKHLHDALVVALGQFTHLVFEELSGVFDHPVAFLQDQLRIGFLEHDGTG